MTGRLHHWARARWHRFVLRCLLGAVVAVIAASISVPVAAAEPEPPPPVAPTAPALSPPESRKHWYGVETLVSDGVSAALLAGGLIPQAGPYFIGAGALGYSFGAPVIHFAHRRPVEGFTSFVLRVPAPLIVGGGTALAFCARVGGDFCGVAGVAPALTLVAVAVVVDAVFLSHEVVRPRPARDDARARLRITPTLAVTRQQALLGLAVTM
jgi:hypothetical protein